MLIYINFPEGGLFDTRNLEYIKIYSHNYVNKFNTTTINLFKEYSVVKKVVKTNPETAQPHYLFHMQDIKHHSIFDRKHET